VSMTSASGCGGAPSVVSMHIWERWQEQARQSLQAWAGFPADREPRPLVLLSPAVRCGGFCDGQQKMAFRHGAIEAAPGFPGPVLQALRGRPQPYAGLPLQAMTATLGSAEFDTDRGPRELPAWEVQARDVPGSFQVLDPATRQLAWLPPGPGQTWRGSTATIDTSGCIVRMSFLGDHRAYTDYDAELLESGTAVALLLTPVKIFVGPRTVSAHSATAQRRGVTLVLDQPLGGRVLLDAQGSPVLVNTW
jgi:hypothetical protein